MENVDKPEPAEQNGDSKAKKRDKVRSAWISFAGRIVAQIVGAIATVALGVMVLHRYTSADARPPAPEQRQETYAQPAANAPPQPQVHVIVLTPAMLGLRDIGGHSVAADRPCSPRLDDPSTSAAHFDNGTFLSR